MMRVISPATCSTSALACVVLKAIAARGKTLAPATAI